MRLWARLARGFLQQGLVFPLMTLVYGLRVSGRDNLAGLSGPVLFACNHHLGLDNPLILRAINRRWRRRLAVAAASELWRNPVWWVLNPLLGNGFPIAREGPVRPSLENLGRIIDRGWSVLIYPEGVLTVGGPMKPFMQGVGLVAVEGRIPVVPLCGWTSPGPVRLPGFPYFVEVGWISALAHPLRSPPAPTTSKQQRPLSRPSSHSDCQGRGQSGPERRSDGVQDSIPAIWRCHPGQESALFG